MPALREYWRRFWALSWRRKGPALAIGMLVPLVYLMVKRSRRMRAIQQQLPDVLDLLARAVRAGESLDQAIALAGREMPEPLGPEFRRCAHQLEMGLSYTGTMHSLARRVRTVELRILVTSLLVHQKTGGKLPPVLERLAGVVRDRLSYRRQFRAATASGRLSAVLIATAGPLVFLYMMTFQPDYIRGFFEQPLGWSLLAAAVGLQLLGLTWIAGLLRTDY